MTEHEPVYVEYNETGTSQEVNGRVARMIRWLCETKQIVNEISKGEIRFCFAGDSLSTHTTIVDSKVS